MSEKATVTSLDKRMSVVEGWCIDTNGDIKEIRKRVDRLFYTLLGGVGGLCAVLLGVILPVLLEK